MKACFFTYGRVLLDDECPSKILVFIKFNQCRYKYVIKNCIVVAIYLLLV